jgi:ATP-dependent helicase HrpA
MAVPETKSNLLSRVHYPPELPITARKDEIVGKIRDCQVIILAGETGSGKTTQIPKMCLEAGLGKKGLIGCTQPRRVAALSIARRLAQELNLDHGREIGSKIRFNDQTGAQTVIKVMTDGILLAETQGDPDLRQYECIIIDEAHERSLNIDFLLGHLKLLLPRRPELKLVVTSATIETSAFSKAFNDAPVIEVSGRMFPVELLYRPLDELAEERGDFTYIEAAAESVEELIHQHPPGDILIFMPGEKDIRETRDLLQGRFGSSREIIPLFGRLSSGDQQRVFSPGGDPRIVIATNIAETSLTIPRIRYVIDSGLARISRYNPRTRTKRLPIEPVSQSSADQRKGRCGRVAEGLCIRLYSEDDFEKRPRYTQPEIQRANLAEVILRMKAFHLGEVESFPFLNPPQAGAIKTGYQLLIEIGALDSNRNLTPLGWDLARLPVDPAIGRMILQAVKEKALSEVLVIAAGLSIQDPRERPMDAKEAAEQAHKRFLDPQSDFLTLLKIWNAYHDEFERLKTQNQMRRFCRSHFLSYLRMREWTDIHAQLEESLETVDFTSLGETITTLRAPGRPDPNKAMDPAHYAAIHRCVLSGLLTHIAQRQEKNIYRATGNREVLVFPGSNLFDKNPGPAKSGRRAGQGPPATPPKTWQATWVVAGELVETSRLFARTVAGISPEWVLELGSHLCKFLHEDPHWSAQAGRVLVRERALLGGLELSSRLVPYGPVNPSDATRIFIRAALIEEPIQIPHRFHQHNTRLREKLENYQTRLRSAVLPEVDEALLRFYQSRLSGVSSVHDLNRFVKESGEAHLFATEEDLIGKAKIQWDTASFPNALEIAGRPVSLRYAYAPGEERDGLTVQVPFTLLQHVQPAVLEWAVPGWREEKIRNLLKALPKSLRVPLMPIEPKVAEIVRELKPGGDSLLEALSQFIRVHYKVNVTPASWPPDALPDYLKPRVEVTGLKNETIASGRQLESLKSKLREEEKKLESTAWDKAAAQFEKYDLQSWDFGDLPAEIELSPGAPSEKTGRSTTAIPVPILAYSALQLEDGHVSVRLFRNREQAIQASAAGIAKLAERALERELAWLEKDLEAGLKSVKHLYITLGSSEELAESSLSNLRDYLFEHDTIYPLTRASFDRLVSSAKARLPGLLPAFLDQLSAILQLRQELLLSSKQYPGMRADLDALLPKDFPAILPFERLRHLPRYLKGMRIRADRAALNSRKDAEKALQLGPLLRSFRELRQRKNLSPEQKQSLEQFRWLIEEFKVSLFAQELGTALPVSVKRLANFLQEHQLQF